MRKLRIKEAICAQGHKASSEWTGTTACPLFSLLSCRYASGLGFPIGPQGQLSSCSYGN